MLVVWETLTQAPWIAPRAQSFCIEPSRKWPQILSHTASSMFWLPTRVGTLLGKSEQRRILKSQSLLMFLTWATNNMQGLLSGSFTGRPTPWNCSCPGDRHIWEGARLSSSKRKTRSNPDYEMLFHLSIWWIYMLAIGTPLIVGNKKAQGATFIIIIAGRRGHQLELLAGTPSLGFTIVVWEPC